MSRKKDSFEELEKKMEQRLASRRRDVTIPRHQDTEIEGEHKIAITVRLPQSLWERTHMAKIKTRKAINQIIVAALERYLQELGH